MWSSSQFEAMVADRNVWKALALETVEVSQAIEGELIVQSRWLELVFAAVLNGAFTALFGLLGLAALGVI